MVYRNFGKTGIKISALGFGAMRLPSNSVDGKNVLDVEESVRIIHRAFELGVNYIDSAPYYCDGESEVIVGKALKAWRADKARERIYVSTKNPIENASGADWLKRLEKSLKKLDLDSIDFYHMWGINWTAWEKNIDVKDGPLGAALKAKEEGLIKHISFSFHDAAENLPKLIDTGAFETMLVQYNLLDRSNEAGIARAKEKGLGVVVMGPVGGGRLGAPSPTIQALLPGKASSSAEIAMRFVLSNPAVDCALSGMGSMAMVEENARIASNSAPLSAQEMARVNASMEENKKLEGLYCTGCNYCMPCPFGVDIPLNFRLMNYHRVYKITDYARGEYRQIGKVDWMKGKPAGDCTECGECEAKCPQKLEIRKQLKETAAVLGA
jgi:predicted aldo/keto reductase-like oxidoreductase